VSVGMSKVWDGMKTHLVLGLSLTEYVQFKYSMHFWLIHDEQTPSISVLLSPFVRTYFIDFISFFKAELAYFTTYNFIRTTHHLMEWSGLAMSPLNPRQPGPSSSRSLPPPSSGAQAQCMCNSNK
jgi:hypothetical protein